MHRKRIRGRNTKPSIKNTDLPYGEKLVEEGNSVLELGAGYFVDTAQMSLWFPENDVYGLERDIILDEKGEYVADGKFTYNRMKEIVEKAFPEVDDILSCFEVVKGDARDLSTFSSDYFNRVISNGLLHYLERADRETVYAEAFNVMAKGGILVARCISGEDLEVFEAMKGSYDWEKVRKTVWKGERCYKNPDPNVEKQREPFVSDIQSLSEESGIVPTEKDMHKIEQVAGKTYAFHVGGLTPDEIDAALKAVGYNDIVIDNSKMPRGSGYRVVKFLEICARKP
jgi:hypothetical protein